MADDVAAPFSSDSSKEFHARIEQYIRAAEAHMNLPHNTIAGILADNDFLFVVKMCAVIEPLLREAVREHVGSFLAFLPVTATKSETLLKAIGDLHHEQLRKTVREIDAISDKTSEFIYALFLVRDRYAHHIANAHLSVEQVCEKIAKEGGDGKLLPKLTGVDSISPSLLRLAMFYNFALLLQAVIQLAKPPPQQPPGILSGLMAREQPLTRT